MKRDNYLEDRIWQRKQKDKWLQLLRSGDHRAFGQFIDKYKEMVFLCGRRMGLREDELEDVASETFFAAYNGLKSYSGQAQLSTWLWGIAYRQTVNYLRKNRRYRQLEVESSEQIADSEQKMPVAIIQRKEKAEAIWEAVKQLPKLWAMAVILYYREEKTVSDIAKIMQLKENTVKTYLFRAREKLKEMLMPIFGEDIDVAK